MIAASGTASAIASANTLIGASLALSARTRYNTFGREPPAPMTGFALSTYGRI